MSPIFMIDDLDLHSVHIQGIAVHMDLWRSLWRQQWLTQKIVIKNLSISADHTDLDSSSIFSTLISEILTQPNIVLEQVKIINSKSFLPVKSFKILIQNNRQYHYLSGKINLNPAAFSNLILPALNFNMHLKWYQDNETTELESSETHVNNIDLNLSAHWFLKFEKNKSPKLIFLGNLQLPKISTFSDYTPNHLLSPTLNNWLKNGLISGALPNTSLLFRGRLADFPFDHNQGHFEAIADLSHVELHFAKNWPNVKKINGAVYVDNRSMTIKIANPTLAGMEIKNVQASIPDLENPILAIQAITDPDFSTALLFLNKTPLAISKDLADVRGNGLLHVHFQMQLPLNISNAAPQTSGSIQFSHNILALPKWHMNLNNLTGTMQFQNDNLSGKNLTATLFNQPLALNIVTQTKPVRAVHINVVGTIVAADLTKRFELTLLKNIKGQAAFHAEVILHDVTSLIKNTVKLTSNLKGISIENSPAPFSKSALTILPLNITLNIQRNNILKLFGNISNWFSGTFLFSQSGDLTRFISGELQHQDLYIKITPVKTGMLFQLNGNDAMGEILYPDNKNEIMTADFKKLFLVTHDALSKKTITHLIFNPAIIPSLNIHIADFRFNQQPDGTVILKTSQTEQGMLIHQFAMQSQAFNLNAKGSWLNQKDHQETALTGEFNSADLGQFLLTRHISARLKNGAIESSFALRWLGSPKDFAFSTAAGQVDMRVGKGRIMQLDSETESNLDFGRLLNLFSLESFSQYLSFNFSSVSKKGFQFDQFNGLFLFHDGKITTKNAVMDGPLAKINLSGVIGLGDESNNITMIVMPYVSSSLPFIVGIAGGPIAGAATWVVNKLASPAMGHLMESKYKITGKWNKLKIQKFS